MQNLRSYVESRANRVIELIAKVRSFGSGEQSTVFPAWNDTDDGTRSSMCQRRALSCLCGTWLLLPALPSGCTCPAAAAAAGVPQIESFDAVPKISEIVAASDAVMVARGDLGAQIRVS